MIKVGMIGYGNIGITHAENIMSGKVPGMELCAVCVRSEEGRKAILEKYTDIPVFKTATELYQSGLCDTILIATPHYSHTELAIEAFSYGLNVILEKPAGVYTRQVKEMNNAAARSGKLFCMMYNQRTNPVYQKLREMVQSGELGHIKRITWMITDWYRSQAYHDSSAWRSTWKTEGGGALINQNLHQLDLWQWMFGMPDRVFSKVGFGKYFDIEVEDDVCAYFEYDNGTTGQYITSTGETPGTNRLEIACDMGKVVIEDNKLVFHKNAISEREFNRINTEPFGKPECHEQNIPVDFSGGEGHVGILKDFVSAMQNGTELLAKGEDGILGLTIANGILLSAWTGEMVNLKEFPHDKFYEHLMEKSCEQTHDTAMNAVKNGKCIIIGAGDLTMGELAVQEEDYVISVDGGLSYCPILAVEPDIIIGDFDSVSEQEKLAVESLKEQIPERVIELPAEKDDTDMLAAMKYGLELGYRDFRIYAGTGGRFDHTLANIQCLLYLKNHGATGYLVDGTGMILVLQNEAVHFNKNLEGYLSLFSLGKEAKGVTIQGMKYPLNHYTLTNDFPIGISNEFIGEEASISVENGELVCMISYCQ